MTGGGSEAGIVFQNNVTTNDRNVMIQGSAIAGNSCVGVDFSSRTIQFLGGGTRAFSAAVSSCTIQGVGVDMNGVLFATDEGMHPSKITLALRSDKTQQ